MTSAQPRGGCGAQLGPQALPHPVRPMQAASGTQHDQANNINRRPKANAH